MDLEAVVDRHAVPDPQEQVGCRAPQGDVALGVALVERDALRSEPDEPLAGTVEAVVGGVQVDRARCPAEDAPRAGGVRTPRGARRPRRRRGPGRSGPARRPTGGRPSPAPSGGRRTSPAGVRPTWARWPATSMCSSRSASSAAPASNQPGRRVALGRSAPPCACAPARSAPRRSWARTHACAPDVWARSCVRSHPGQDGTAAEGSAAPRREQGGAVGAKVLDVGGGIHAAEPATRGGR